MASSQQKIPASPHKGHRERLKQQFLTFGDTAMNDHQLLELLLFFSIPRRDTNPLAHALLDRFGSLEGIFSATHQELTEVKGVNDHTADLLRLLPMVIAQTPPLAYSAPLLDTRPKIVEYLRFYAEQLPLGQFILLSLSDMFQPIGMDFLDMELQSPVLLKKRTFTQCALAHQGVFFVLACRREDDFLCPTPEDIETAKLCRNASAQLHCQLRDYILYGKDEHYAMGRTISMLL